MVSGGCIGGIWMVSLDVCGVWMCLNGCLGAHPLQGGEFTLFWHSPERQHFLDALASLVLVMSVDP